MSNGMFSWLISGAMVLGTGSLWADPVEITAPIERIFVPNGYDDNDNIELILHGKFRNTCYRVGHASAKVDVAAHAVFVHATAYQYPAADCAEVITPFIQSVKIGILPEGRYRIVFVENQSVSERLVVRSASSVAADEHFYAPVEMADIRSIPETGSHELVLQGMYPRMLIGCAVFQEVRVVKDAADLIMVQPILRVTEDPAECEGQPIDFKRVMQLGSFLERGGLLHVRVLNGNSVNRYFSN
jgi:hypothetical protein